MTKLSVRARAEYLAAAAYLARHDRMPEVSISVEYAISDDPDEFAEYVAESRRMYANALGPNFDAGTEN